MKLHVKGKMAERKKDGKKKKKKEQESAEPISGLKKLAPFFIAK